jgi:hypothetical protein
MNKFNIIALDFEFTTLERTSLVLISGAISNVFKEAKVIKLRGNPLLLRKSSNTVIELEKSKKNLVIRNILRIFKDKPQNATPLLKELNDSFLTKTSNLKTNFIQMYCEHNNRTPIIITWNGHTDNEILKRLNIQYSVLSLTSYDIDNNGIFYLQLINLYNKQNIAQIKLGRINKIGRLTDLNETHDMICKTNHNKTYLHDPVTDVHLTKCLFNHLNNVTEIPINKITNLTHNYTTTNISTPK